MYFKFDRITAVSPAFEAAVSPAAATLLRVQLFTSSGEPAEGLPTHQSRPGGSEFSDMSASDTARLPAAPRRDCVLGCGRLERREGELCVEGFFFCKLKKCLVKVV